MEIITVWKILCLKYESHHVHVYTYNKYSVNGYGSKKLDEFRHVRLAHKI